MALIPEDDSVNSRMASGIADAESEIDSAYKFSVMGFGSDVENMSSFAGLCLLRAMSDQPDKLKQIPPLEELVTDDVPVFWYLRHHATQTESILKYLESKLDGLRFLCSSLDGVNPDGTLDNSLLDDDDFELHEIVHSFYRHPANADALECGRAGSTGTIIGIDLDALYNYALLLVDEETPVEVTIPSDFMNYLRPLSKRLGFCMGENSRSFVRAYYSIVLNDSSFKSKLRSPGSRRAGEDLTLLNSIYDNTPVKIVDLGNACWTHRHFTDDIQTRQYRSPEVIIGAKYDTSADIWSLACIVFELLTGDLLFDPQAGKHWDRDEDHLAMIAELVGDFPRKITQVGKRSSQYFNKRGELRHIQDLKYWPLKVVLRDKYLFSEEDATSTADFLEQLLTV